MVTKLIIAAFVSIVVAFVMAAAESSLSRLSRHRAGELVEEGRRGASALAIIVADSAAYLSVAAFVRVLAESAAAVLITLAVVDSVNDFWPDPADLHRGDGRGLLCPGRGLTADAGPPAC